MSKKPFATTLIEGLIDKIRDFAKKTGIDKRVIVGASVYHFFLQSESSQRKIIEEYLDAENNDKI
ncbi:MAG: hypothetical protein AB1567_12535 [bacterium]